MKVLKLGASEPGPDTPITCARCGKPAYRWRVPLEHYDGETVAALYVNYCEEHAAEWPVRLEKVSVSAKYRVRLWCPDCSADDDEQGCFGGGAETQEELYDTLDEAVEAGCLSTHRTVWDFEVVDENGKVIELED